MVRRKDAKKQRLIFALPFYAVALATLGYGVSGLFSSSPESWTLVLTVVVGVIICGSFQVHVGRGKTFPTLGVAITMLAIQPLQEAPFLGVSIWAFGVLISQTIVRRHLLHALYITGLSSLAAFAFVAIELALTDAGLWQLPSFAVAAVGYYAVFLLGEFGRQRTRAGVHRGFSLTDISLARVGSVVLIVSVTATGMQFIDAAVIPWLEFDTDMRRAPFVVLLAASLFYVLAQRIRSADIEQRLSALVDAAVEIPRETGPELASALQRRAAAAVQGETELRDSAPERPEIGVAVSLDPNRDQYLVATRKVGGASFTREDEQALTTLAYVASEASRVQNEVDALERRANSDPLTGLPNYGAFQQALVNANENRPYHEGIALLFIDVDNFKKLNDSYGHRAGDELLRTLAQRLQLAAGGGDFVSRVGGDEFVVIFSGLVSIEQARESAEGIIEALGERLVLEGDSFRPVVSAGLAFSSHREIDAQTLVEDADRTMLEVKRLQRRDGSGTQSSLRISSHRSTRTNEIVARAIREDRLTLAFQPIVSLEDNTIWAFEALLRYLDPELGPISPPSLVARAKSLGLMNELTRQVITKALDAAEEFARIEPSITCMTVNLELGQLSESELGPFIRDAARAHPSLSLCIELNESSLRSVTDELRVNAESLQQAGVLIALDDYGSDDSSVGALVRFPMDILKIDKSLINELDDVRQREIIKSLQGFGDNLNYTVVVEGIENQETTNVLVGLGVRSAQGYFYGRPITRSLTADRLRKSGPRACS